MFSLRIIRASGPVGGRGYGVMQANIQNFGSWSGAADKASQLEDADCKQKDGFQGKVFIRFPPG